MNIIYLSKTLPASTLDLTWVNEPITFINEYHFTLNGVNYEFDYLIINDLSLAINLFNLQIMLDDNIPIVNCFYQTSVDHIYFLNNLNLKTVINHLINNDL